jgi:hypothetical protein
MKRRERRWKDFRTSWHKASQRVAPIFAAILVIVGHVRRIGAQCGHSAACGAGPFESRYEAGFA